MISWMAFYLAPFLAAFVAGGIVLQLADRYVGVKIYRWYYNRGNSPADHIPASEEVGFFYRQSPKRQHNRALFVSAVQSIATVWAGTYTPWELVGEIFALVLEGWFLLPGLWLGNKIYAALQKQDEFLHAYEHKGETMLGILAKAKGLLGGFLKFVPAAKPAEASSDAGRQGSPPVAPTKSMSAADILRRHTDGRKL